MRYYIATVWYLAPSMDESFLQMRIIREEADNEDHFIETIQLMHKEIEPGSQLWFGPISLSKKQ